MELVSVTVRHAVRYEYKCSILDRHESTLPGSTGHRVLHVKCLFLDLLCTIAILYYTFVLIL